VKTFDIVVALDRQRGIGKDNRLPWNLPGDMRFFKQTTSEAPPGQRNAVIMGRKTWESIAEKRKPLPGRLNIVLSRRSDLQLPETVLRACSLDEAMQLTGQDSSLFSLFVIGGAAVYDEAVRHPACRRLFVTEIDGVFACDTFLQTFPDRFVEKSRREATPEGDVRYAFVTYEAENALAPHLVV
jgi:dihydrofolate reductase